MTDRIDEYERTNRAFWDADADDYQAAHHTAISDAAWGAYRIPESELQILGALSGLDVLELGCGAAQWSIALASAGAQVVGLDTSGEQLAHARRAINDTVITDSDHQGSTVALVQAAAEAVPLASASFDLVLSDHGAMSYVDPDRSLPEMARLLRPGGRLVFNQYTPLLALCWDDEHEGPTEQLHRPWSDLGRWADVTGFVSWDLGPGEWIRRLRAHGFEVKDLIDLCPPAGATSSYHDPATVAWAHRWPLEQLWIARRSW